MGHIDSHKLDAMLIEHRRFMSPLQIGHFVLEASSAGTWYGFYMQALRELHSRVSEARRALLSVEELRRKIDRPCSVIEDGDIVRARANLDLEDAVSILREQWQQAYIFYKYAEHARALLPDVLTQEVRNDLDAEFWASTMGKQAYVDRLTTGRVSAETMRAICSLPIEVARPIVLRAMSHEDEDGKVYKLDVPTFLPPEMNLSEIKELLESAAPLRIS